MILQGTVQGGRREGRQKKRWEDNNIRIDRINGWVKPFERLRTERNEEKSLPDHP